MSKDVNSKCAEKCRPLEADLVTPGKRARVRRPNSKTGQNVCKNGFQDDCWLREVGEGMNEYFKRESAKVWDLESFILN